MTSKEKAGEILQKQGNNNNKYTKDPGPQIYVSNNNKKFRSKIIFEQKKRKMYKSCIIND